MKITRFRNRPCLIQPQLRNESTLLVCHRKWFAAVTVDMTRVHTGGFLIFEPRRPTVGWFRGVAETILLGRTSVQELRIDGWRS